MCHSFKVENFRCFRQLTLGRPEQPLGRVNLTPGVLETLLWRSLAADPLVACVDQFLDCVSPADGGGASPREEVTDLQLHRRPRSALASARTGGTGPFLSVVVAGLQRDQGFYPG